MSTPTYVDSVQMPWMFQTPTAYYPGDPSAAHPMVLGGLGRTPPLVDCVARGRAFGRARMEQSGIHGGPRRVGVLGLGAEPVPPSTGPGGLMTDWRALENRTGGYVLWRLFLAGATAAMAYAVLGHSKKHFVLPIAAGSFMAHEGLARLGVLGFGGWALAKKRR